MFCRSLFSVWCFVDRCFLHTENSYLQNTTQKTTIYKTPHRKDRTTPTSLKAVSYNIFLSTLIIECIINTFDNSLLVVWKSRKQNFIKSFKINLPCTSGGPTHNKFISTFYFPVFWKYKQIPLWRLLKRWLIEKKIVAQKIPVWHIKVLLIINRKHHTEKIEQHQPH
jgi:hypothetical protein